MQQRNYGYSGINWGDYQKMPDYREGWRDPHASGIGGLLKTLDVGSYIPGLKEVHNRVDDATTQNLTEANRALSPVVKGINQGLDVIDPTAKWLKKNTYLGDINNFVEEKPADALAVAAATYFSAGAATEAAAGAGATAAPAASGGAGATGGMAGASSTAASGTAGISALGSEAITPALSSTAGAQISNAAAAGAAATGYGGLGAAGTAAGSAMLTPAFASLGTGAAGSGLLNSAKNIYSKFNKYDQYRSNISKFAGNQHSERDRMNAQAGALADRILNEYQPTDYRQKIANQIMMNRYGMRK